jgi:hypothetical protein
MLPTLLRLLCAGCLLGPGEAPEIRSFLYRPAYCTDDVLRGPAEPYLPQAGDLFFATDASPWLRGGHRLAGAASPHHSGVVVALPDGGLGLLEAGPFHTTEVGTYDLLPELEGYTRQGLVWLRCRIAPLTPEQSARLTTFALAQEGKSFAALRLLSQLTPFRYRGPLRTRFVGKPHGDRPRYICSELVVEALVAAGLLDDATARPAATFPRDLFFDRSPNPYLDRHLDLSAGWCPPARWLPCPAPAGPPSDSP